MGWAEIKGLSDNASRAEIVNAVGRGWVAGLIWRSFANYPTLSERREDAQALGAEWVVLRESFDIIQAGFCPAVLPGKPKKLYSLAAAIAEEYQQPWCGVFKLSEKSWWYIAVRDGQAVLPDGDVVGDYATVLAARRRHEAYGDWNVYDGTLDDIKPLLEFSKKNVRLLPVRSVEPVSIWTIVTPLALAVAVIVGGGVLFMQHERQVHRAAQQAVHRIVVNISPLHRTPMPDEWLAACGSIIKSLPISTGGWLAEKVSCSGESAAILWQRLDAAALSSRPEGELSDDGNEVVQVRPLMRLPPGLDIMLSEQEEVETLFSILQSIGVQAGVGSPTRDSGGAYVSQTVNFTLPIPPFNLDFNKVPGLRFTSLTWTDSGWTLEGSLYGK